MSELLLYDQILEQITDIQKGDIVYIVSDVTQLAWAFLQAGEKFDPDKLIDAVCRKVGPEGTVLIPTFNWGFCRGETFDIRKTPSKVGSLTNKALKRQDFKRTKHPIYSFVAWGKDREMLQGWDYKDSFGPGTIFEYMHTNKAKALVVGLRPLDGLTFYHYVEQAVGVPYRFVKDFTAGYIDENGVESVKTYSMYVRDLEMDAQPIDMARPLGNILQSLGVSRHYTINGVPFHVVDLENMYKVEEIDIKLNDCGNMYTYKHI